MKYFGIQVNLTVSVFTLGLTEGKPIYQAWEQLMTKEVVPFLRHMFIKEKKYYGKYLKKKTTQF